MYVSLNYNRTAPTVRLFFCPPCKGYFKKLTSFHGGRDVSRSLWNGSLTVKFFYFISALQGFSLKVKFILRRERRFSLSLEWFSLGQVLFIFIFDPQREDIKNTHMVK